MNKVGRSIGKSLKTVSDSRMCAYTYIYTCTHTYIHTHKCKHTDTHVVKLHRYKLKIKLTKGNLFIEY